MRSASSPRAGQHEDRHVRAGADGAAEVEAVAVGQHQVEDDRVVAAAEGGGETGVCALATVERHARALQIGRHHPGERAVVLDHQQAGGRLAPGHGCRAPFSVPSYESANACRAAKRSGSLMMRGTLFCPPSLPRLFIHAAKAPAGRKRTRAASMP